MFCIYYMFLYRHMDDSKGRAYELQQAAVKCMRGILFCYMRQADKVSHYCHQFWIFTFL